MNDPDKWVPEFPKMMILGEKRAKSLLKKMSRKSSLHQVMARERAVVLMMMLRIWLLMRLAVVEEMIPVSRILQGQPRSSQTK